MNLIYVPLSSKICTAVSDAIKESKEKKDGKMLKRIGSAVVATVVLHYTFNIHY